MTAYDKITHPSVAVQCILQQRKFTKTYSQSNNVLFVIAYLFFKNKLAIVITISSIMFLNHIQDGQSNI